MTNQETYMKTLQSPSLIAKYSEQLDSKFTKLTMVIAYSSKTITIDELNERYTEMVADLNSDTPPQAADVDDNGNESNARPMSVVAVADELIFDTLTGHLGLEFIIEKH